jgi:two-component system, cell cycle sensor histidine kinase and response regulator CckA
VADRATHDETIALLEATLDATHDAILVVDLHGHVIRCNRRCFDMLGFTAEELARGGLDLIFDRLSSLQDDPLEARSTKALLSGDPAAEHLDVLHFKDGRILERYIAPHQVNGRVVGRVASFRDIGESVRAAQALDQHRAFLEQAQEVAHVGSWVAELDGSDHAGWSAETHRIFGLPPGAFNGTAAAFYEHVHPDDRDAVLAAGQAAIQEGRPFDIEHRIVRPDGTVRFVHERGTAVRDAQGKPLRMIGTVQDITDRRLLEDQLRQSQKMEAIGRLAGGIAHDLNNALTAIAGYAELALGELKAETIARADVEEIRRAAERAGSVTRQLLAFSRKQLIEARVFDLNETVAAIARLLSRLLGTDVRLETLVAPEALPVRADPGQVEQAIINLAVNARDAMPAGGQITLTTAREAVDDEFARTHLPMTPGEYAVLSVADTGHGMTRETQARIFEPFFTTKEIGKGTGLGLSMVYGTLKRSGGFIFVDSEVGRGTTFRLYFPAARADAPAPEPPAPREERPRGNETLLVVEDETSVRNLIASALKNDGYDLLLAGSAEEALTIVDSFKGSIDLLLTDAILPGRGGVELVAEMAKRRPGLRVLMMSGYTEDALSIGSGVALLQKPFTPRELRQRIREALAR